ncbi:MAG: hypothetical protein GWM90_17745, partial [Gemmatimonadetes bacterium]|nr:hypothetical protein [Gemmatimonadota bacterium]NIQ56193.1 hypothetical protein [Gemmatimonadota bacterium]NIU76387.1 hypothetical protein [Gammaproteobacteria bacterium]NIX45868.1 hypothetical protein [Gemmatimonadota bacterium]NIY10174.1 hypothetical protein [Gemmatimonadota bacterium]
LLTVQHRYAAADSLYDELLRRTPDFALGWMGRLLNAVAAGDLETARLCVPGAVDGPARDALREVLDG